MFEIAHAPSARRASALGLWAPIELAHFGIRVSTRCASLLLNVIGHFTATTTARVGFVVALSEAGGSFCLR